MWTAGCASWRDEESKRYLPEDARATCGTRTGWQTDLRQIGCVIMHIVSPLGEIYSDRRAELVKADLPRNSVYEDART